MFFILLRGLEKIDLICCVLLFKQIFFTLSRSWRTNQNLINDLVTSRLNLSKESNFGDKNVVLETTVIEFKPIQLTIIIIWLNVLCNLGQSISEWHLNRTTYFFKYFKFYLLKTHLKWLQCLGKRNLEPEKMVIYNMIFT